MINQPKGIIRLEDDMEKKRVLLKKSGQSRIFRKKFEESELRYRSLLKQLPVGVYRSTPEGRVVEVNPALTVMLGYTEAELRRLDIPQLYCRKTDRDGFIARMEKAPINVSEYRLRKKAGGSIWVRDYCRAVKGPDRKIAYFDGILADITREKKAEDKVKKVLDQLQESNAERQTMIQKLEGTSVTDELTGLYNRRGFYTITKEYLNMAVRKKIPMYLLFMDMDDLKVDERRLRPSHRRRSPPPAGPDPPVHVPQLRHQGPDGRRRVRRLSDRFDSRRRRGGDPPPGPVMDPMWAKKVSEQGYTKQEAEEYIWSHATKTVAEFRSDFFYPPFIEPSLRGKPWYGQTGLWPATYLDLPLDEVVQAFPKGSILIAVVGGETNPYVQAWQFSRPCSVSVDKWR